MRTTKAGEFPEMHVFPNGYGASVVNNGYGKRTGLLEIMPLFRGDEIDNAELYNLMPEYSWSDQVLGWCSREDIDNILAKIRQLESRESNA